MSTRLGTIDTICAHYERLSDTERRVADFILHNQREVMHLSVREIARESGTSGATVSRFVRSVGYDSFADLRLALAALERPDGDGLDRASVNGVSLDDVRGSIEYVLNAKLQELRATAEQLSAKSVKDVVELIRSADTICFAAVGNSIPACQNMAFKLGQIGLRVMCPATTESMILASLSLRSTDALFIVSSSGYSRRLETIMDNAEDAGTPVVLVTGNRASELAPRADLVLGAATRDQMLAGGQFSSHVSVNFILETIFLLVLASRKESRELARLERKSLGKDKASRPTFD